MHVQTNKHVVWPKFDSKNSFWVALFVLSLFYFFYYIYIYIYPNYLHFCHTSGVIYFQIWLFLSKSARIVFCGTRETEIWTQQDTWRNQMKTGDMMNTEQQERARGTVTWWAEKQDMAAFVMQAHQPNQLPKSNLQFLQSSSAQCNAIYALETANTRAFGLIIYPTRNYFYFLHRPLTTS